MARQKGKKGKELSLADVKIVESPDFRSFFVNVMRGGFAGPDEFRILLCDRKPPRRKDALPVDVTEAEIIITKEHVKRTIAWLSKSLDNHEKFQKVEGEPKE